MSQSSSNKRPHSPSPSPPIVSEAMPQTRPSVPADLFSKEPEMDVFSPADTGQPSDSNATGIDLELNRLPPSDYEPKSVPLKLSDELTKAPYRLRRRRFNYFSTLPYDVESQEDRENHLKIIIKKLAATIEGDDLKGIVGASTAPGFSYWTRELKSWLELKFDMPLEVRIKLMSLYFEICLCGIDCLNLDMMVNMYCDLAKDETLLRTVKPENIALDWRKLLKVLKKLSFPVSSGYESEVSKTFSSISRLAIISRNFMPYSFSLDVFNEILPFFSLAKHSVPHNVLNLLIALLPTIPLSQDQMGDSMDKIKAAVKIEKTATDSSTVLFYLPTLFHLWSLHNRSPLFDFQCLEITSEVVGDAIGSELVEYSKNGVLDSDQLSVAFAAILRMLEVPVSYVGSPYLRSDIAVSFKSEKEKRGRISTAIGTLVVFSMAGDVCLEPDGIMDRLDSLLHSIETFCHPSNTGPWTRIIISSVANMIDLFSLRWNAQSSGESIIPSSRRLTDNICERFVVSLRDVVFLGIHSKSASVSKTSLSCLQGLAYLKPDLIIPNILKEVYPSLEGLLETHRTISALNALTFLARIIARTPRYAFHIPSLLHLSIPGVDPNDLSKTLHTLGMVQAFALNVPFYQLESNSDSDAYGGDCVSADIAAFTEDQDLPEFSEAQLESAIQISTAAFEDFVMLFFGCVFGLLESLPDGMSNSKNENSPETHVINSLSPTITAVLGSCSPDLFRRVLHQVKNFVSSNVIHAATDAIAHICGCLVVVNPEVAFNELFPMLYSHARYEVEENSAGSTRSGAEFLPRDRALIWNISCLNMSLANAGKEVLKHKTEIKELIMLLRDNCRGHIIYHISNTLHHTLMTLSTVYVSDFYLVDPSEQSNVSYKAHWGQAMSEDNLNVNWHIPCAEEVAFAVELYREHFSKSQENIRNLISGQIKPSSVTEFSDAMLSNLTYIRTGTSGISNLFDSKYSATQEDSTMEDVVVADAMSEGEEEYMDFSDIDSVSEDMLNSAGSAALSDIFEADDDWGSDFLEGSLRRYPAGDIWAILGGSSGFSDVYKVLHETRLQIGDFLHDIHSYLVSNRENDFSSFKALMFAYKVWMSDVGLERSARPFECIASMYVYETKNYRISGVRKDYPRPVLARRAHMYHTERLVHNISPRIASDQEKKLVKDILISVVSIYPDIQRNALSALESAARVIIRGRQFMYAVLLQVSTTALNEGDHRKLISGLKAISGRAISPCIRKDYNYFVKLLDLIFRSMRVDYPGLNEIVTHLYGLFANSLKLPLDVLLLEKRPVYDIIRYVGGFLEDDHQRILKMRVKRERKRKEAVAAVESIESYIIQLNDSTTRSTTPEPLTEGADGSVASSNGKFADNYWKVAAARAGICAAVGTSIQFKIDPQLLVNLFDNGGLHQHPGVKGMCMHGLFCSLRKMLSLARTGYSYEHYLLSFDDAVNDRIWDDDIAKYVDVVPGFSGLYTNEMSNFSNPTWYNDFVRVGWLVWPSRFIVENPNTPKQKLAFDSEDQKAMEALGKVVTKAWLEKVIARHCEEPRDADQSLSSVNIAFFSIILMLVSRGYTELDIHAVLRTIKDLYTEKGYADKNVQRCVGEWCVSLIDRSYYKDADERYSQDALNTVKDIMKQAIENDISPESIVFWKTFITFIPEDLNMDYRRVWPLIELVNNYTIESTSTATFKIGSKLSLQRNLIQSIGWRFQPVEKSLDVLCGNLSSNFKGVRDEVGKTLAAIYTTRFHASFDSVEDMLKSNLELGALGNEKSYQLSQAYEERIVKAFAELEAAREERKVGDISARYLLIAKTVGIWIKRILKSPYANCLVPLLPKVIVPSLLQFLNIRDDSELTVNALEIFKALGNLSYPLWSMQLMVGSLSEIARNLTKWHQLISFLNFVQAFFFRQLFLMDAAQKRELVKTVTYLLGDAQLEVRELAAETLSGMIRCSNKKDQVILIGELQAKFTLTLKNTQSQRKLTAGVEGSKIALQRHCAVLGLGSLVKAFPYASPPPAWIPEVLTTLAARSSADPGMVGKSVKSILSDFKKTRQDTWHIDNKAFTPEQLDDLEGVLWRNYFV